MGSANSTYSQETMGYGSPNKSIIYVSSNFHVKCDGKTIDTVVTSQGPVIEQWVNEILVAHAKDSNDVVGLDIKILDSKPLAMQLCIDTKCLIIQLYYIKEIPQSFKDFLMNPKFTFMGVDADISRLVSRHGLDFAKTVDFRAATINKWPRRFLRHDLKYLAKQIAEFDMNMPDDEQGSYSEWRSAVLGHNEVKCACITAYASYKIAKVILADEDEDEFEEW